MRSWRDGEKDLKFKELVKNKRMKDRFGLIRWSSRSRKDKIKTQKSISLQF